MTQWLEDFTERVHAAFPHRIRFIGIQGSYGRGEATETSDIDMVVILDTFTHEDARTYDRCLAGLPHREKLCGFISGERELRGWDRAELFQFYHDTRPLYGDLDWLAPLLDRASVRRAVHLGACGVYHGCVHNMLHEKSPEIIYSLYKSSFFILQAKYYDQTGTYINTKAALLPLLSGRDALVLQQSMADVPPDPGAASRLLMEWSSGLIAAYAADTATNG